MTSPSQIHRQACVRIELGWPSRKLSPNARLHWTEKHRAVSATRHAAGWKAREAVRPGMFASDETVIVTTTFHPPDHRTYDRDNLSARMKAAYDGIADGIGVDDKHFRHQPVVIGEPVKGGRVVVEIEPADTWEHISEPASRVIASIPVPKREAS